MGSVSLKLPASRRRQGLCSPALLNLLMLLSLLSTNLLAFFAFFAASPRHDPAATTTTPSPSSNLSAHVAAIALEIGGGASSSAAASLPDGLPPELLLFLTPHVLPLGRDARTGLTHMPASVAAACLRSPSALALLSAFMSYAPHSACPRNATLPRRLISKACEPLPRRRCLSRGPRAPLPASGMGLDHRSWAGPPRHAHEFLADDVLRLGGASEIRIGLDVAGGAANFAARMRERGVTVVTSVLDAGGKPMNEFVAARGLFPLLLSPAHRFPFYDGVFDLVHVGTAALDDAGAPAMGQAATPEALEFFMFDVDRVLRAGGLLWIDSYLCQSEERRRVLVKLIEKFGYKKLKWFVGEKAGGATTSIYLSAVLRKPARS